MTEDRPYGIPKTDEERAETHAILYGNEELPPRGTGQQEGSIIEKAARLIVRDLDRSLRADDTKEMTAIGTTDDLIFEQVKPGRELILEYLGGYDDTSSPTRIKVGYWNGHSYNWLNTQPAPLVSETVAINGSVRLREGMYPIVRFIGATASDDLYAALNGYWTEVQGGTKVVLEHDKIRVQYDEIDAITKAYEESIITLEEGVAMKLARTNKIRELFGLDPLV